MFTDVVGYTELVQKNEAMSMELLEEHRRILRPIILSHGGIEVKTMGDAFLIEFTNALQAVISAIEIQKAFRERNLSAEPERRIDIRIGIHVGDVIHSGGDIYGDAVNIASRIQTQSEPSGIVVSSYVVDLVKNKIDANLKKLGLHEFKGVQEPIEIYSVLIPFTDDSSNKHESFSYDDALSIKNRIAVLPLANLSADPNDEYFVDGLTEEIINMLSNISGLRVIARTTTMRYKSATRKGIEEIGRELKVRSILEGSVRRAGNRLRILAQLIDAKTEEYLWSKSFDRDLQDIFAIQSEIARNIAESLSVNLLSAERERIERRINTVGIEAYNLYLKGRYYWNRRTRDDLKKSAEFFEEAIKNDPKYALAYTGLADSYCLLGVYGGLAPKQAHTSSVQFATKAIELDQRLAEAHASLAHALYHYEWDWGRSEEEFKKAVRLNPNYSSAHHWYSEYLGSIGEMSRALEEIQRAQELDPLSLIINTHVSFVLFIAGDYEGAIDQAKRVIDMDRNFAPAYDVLGSIKAEQGKLDDAVEAINKAIALSGGSAGIRASLAYAYSICDKREDAFRIADELKDLPSQYVSPVAIASIYSGLGERDVAFQWLEKAYQERSSKLVDLKVEPTFYKLHSDQRFSDLLRRMNLQGKFILNK